HGCSPKLHLALRIELLEARQRLIGLAVLLKCHNDHVQSVFPLVGHGVSFPRLHDTFCHWTRPSSRRPRPRASVERGGQPTGQYGVGPSDALAKQGTACWVVAPHGSYGLLLLSQHGGVGDIALRALKWRNP